MRLGENRGETAAMLVGMANAKGDIVVTIDADLQNDPADIPHFIAGINEGYDAVCGVRRKREDNALRKISTKVANNVRRTIIGGQILDAGCTYRAFRRECLRDLPWFRGMHRFLPDILANRGFKVKQVKIEDRPRHAGKSKYGLWNRVFAATYDLFAVRWMQQRHINYKITENCNV